jgi:hypothetical protein
MFDEKKEKCEVLVLICYKNSKISLKGQQQQHRHYRWEKEKFSFRCHDQHSPRAGRDVELKLVERDIVDQMVHSSFIEVQNLSFFKYLFQKN